MTSHSDAIKPQLLHCSHMPVAVTPNSPGSTDGEVAIVTTDAASSMRVEQLSAGTQGAVQPACLRQHEGCLEASAPASEAPAAQEGTSRAQDHSTARSQHESDSGPFSWDALRSVREQLEAMCAFDDEDKPGLADSDSSSDLAQSNITPIEQAKRAEPELQLAADAVGSARSADADAQAAAAVPAAADTVADLVAAADLLPHEVAAVNAQQSQSCLLRQNFVDAGSEHSLDPQIGQVPASVQAQEGALPCAQAAVSKAGEGNDAIDDFGELMRSLRLAPISTQPTEQDPQTCAANSCKADDSTELDACTELGAVHDSPNKVSDTGMSAVSAPLGANAKGSKHAAEPSERPAAACANAEGSPNSQQERAEPLGDSQGQAASALEHTQERSRIAVPPRRATSSGGVAWTLDATGSSPSTQQAAAHTRQSQAQHNAASGKSLSAAGALRRLMRKKPTVRQLLGKEATRLPVPVYEVCFHHSLSRSAPRTMYRLTHPARHGPDCNFTVDAAVCQVADVLIRLQHVHSRAPQQVQPRSPSMHRQARAAKHAALSAAAAATKCTPMAEPAEHGSHDVHAKFTGGSAVVKPDARPSSASLPGAGQASKPVQQDATLSLRQPFADAQNRTQLPRAQRRTCTWVQNLPVPLPDSSQGVCNRCTAPGDKAHMQMKTPPARLQRTRKRASATTPVVWSIDFAGDVADVRFDLPKDAAQSAEAPDVQQQQQQQQQPAPTPSNAAGAGNLIAEGATWPASQHPLAVPQPGGITQIRQQRAARATASTAPAVASDAAAVAAASNIAATAATTVPRGTRVYNNLPALSPPTPPPAAADKLAAARRAAALARLPRADMVAPSMRDIWRAEEQVVEVRTCGEMLAAVGGSEGMVHVRQSACLCKGATFAVCTCWM
jgi:hypothetical protein